MKYSAFDVLDGKHPWQDQVPESCVLYNVRQRKSGSILYFNFQLAKEMGLIPENHPHHFSEKLQEKILSTFNLQIINEFDLLKGNYPDANINSRKYMATRYLQLQHPSKTGKTSGDGRSIWNGQIEHNGKVWDVNSRGTGVTSLAPGFVEAGKPIPTGCTSYGYSCGQADLDELIGSALMSEVFHKQGISTERTLAIIRNNQNQGIGVRAAPNLVRPAHLFLHLKQGNHGALMRAADFFIHRQIKNNEWKLSNSKHSKYDFMLENIGKDFARFAARLDADYIFVWLEWDGDNVLANAGIIDYGSVRQFGVRHDQYRFDDVERLSTNLNEQKYKAQYLVQTFAQAVDFIKSGTKKPIEIFKDHPVVKNFEKQFEYHRLVRQLNHAGFSDFQSQKLLHENISLVKAFDKQYRYFERKKVSQAIQKVPDGINRPAMFNMRYLMTAIIENPDFSDHLAEKILLNAYSEFTPVRDRKPNIDLVSRLHQLTNILMALAHSLRGRRSLERILRDLRPRAKTINRLDRITGNGVEHVVQIILGFVRKGASYETIQHTIEGFILSQARPATLRVSSKSVLKSMQAVLLDCKDDL